MYFVSYLAITFMIFLYVYARFVRARSEVQNKTSHLSMRREKVRSMIQSVEENNARLTQRIQELKERIETVKGEIDYEQKQLRKEEPL